MRPWRTSRLTCRASSISSTMLAGCTQLSGTAVPSTSRINTPSPWSKPQHDPVHRQGRTPGGDQFFPCERDCVKEGLHWGFAKAPAALMGSAFVVARDPLIEILLQLGD